MSSKCRIEEALDKVKQKKPMTNLDKLKERFNKYKDRKVLLMFSGGMDSRLLSILLEEAGAEVDRLYLNSQGIGKASNLRIQNRLIKELNQEGMDIETVKDGTCFMGPVPFPGQGLRFLTLAMFRASIYDYVIMGYVSGDDAAFFTDDLKEFWKKGMGFYECKTAELEFPLLSINKNLLTNALHNTDIKCKIKKQYTSCAHPQPFKRVDYKDLYVSCNVCSSCMTSIKDGKLGIEFQDYETIEAIRNNYPRITHTNVEELKEGFFLINAPYTENRKACISMDLYFVRDGSYRRTTIYLEDNAEDPYIKELYDIAEHCESELPLFYDNKEQYYIERGKNEC